MTEHRVVDPSLATLYQLFTCATKNASEAMHRWTSGGVSLSLDRVVEIPVEEIAREFDIANEYMTMVVFTLTGEYGGVFILMFDEENGRHLAASLTQSKVNAESEWTELEKSALSETGNILSGAYFNEISRFTDVDLVPSAPFFMQDFGASVLQQAIIPHVLEADKILICNTRFEKREHEVRWNVLFVPEAKLRDRMVASLETADLG